MMELKSFLKYIELNLGQENNNKVNHYFLIIENNIEKLKDIDNYMHLNFRGFDSLQLVLKQIYCLFVNQNFLEVHPNSLDYIYFAQIIYYMLGESFYQNANYYKALDNFNYALKSLENQQITVKSEIIMTRILNCFVNLGMSHLAIKSAREFLRNNPNSKLVNIALQKLQKQISTFENKVSISLCMIVKNEEDFLADCLSSVNGIVSEIIIVDTGSTDKTKEIAMQFNSQIYEFEWQDDFSLARNESLKHANGEWILYLDADERISNVNINYINNILNNLPDKIGGVMCILESPHSKPDGTSEMHRGAYPRLFRNYGYPKIKFLGKVHEQIAPSIKNLGKEFVDSEVVIQHLGYNRNVNIINEKIKRNYKLLIGQLQEEPLNGYAWFQLGQTLGRMNLIPQAIDAIEFALSTQCLSPSIISSACASLSQFYGNNKEFDKCLINADKSIEISPNQQYARHLRAFALLYLHKFEEAEAEFLKVIKLKTENKFIIESGFDVEIPMELIMMGINNAQRKELPNTANNVT